MRGKLPRSFLFPDALFPVEKRYAWLQDAALSVIAVVGIKSDLASEIVNGILLSQNATDFTVPEYADFGDASNASGTFRNKTDALTAYALGYYLEMNPSTANACDIVKCLRQILYQLETQRNFIDKNGLISDGTNYWSVDNIIAYFAFKQAGSVLNEINYTNTSSQLYTAITTLLWKNNFFIKGIGTSGDITDLHLSYLSYGALFWAENKSVANANILLNKIETLATIDSVNGAKGYKADINSTQVWFEGSYVTATAYYKVGNSAKWKIICNELNKFIDVDGGNVGELLKSDFENTYITYQAVGSTAWTLISNKIKSLAFSTRTGVSVTGCVVPFFNVQKSGSFSKNNCGDNTTTTAVTYIVNAGRYISYVDQPTADNLAIADVNANGQAYANAVGICTSTIPVGNDLMSGSFFSQNCLSSQIAEEYTYTVAANTYTAPTKAEANQLAQNDIDANGQNAANTANQCVDNSYQNFVWVNSLATDSYSSTAVYATVYLSQRANTLIIVKGKVTDIGGNYQTWSIDVNGGQYQSGEVLVGTFQSGLYQGNISIDSISPSTYNGVTYTF